MSNSESRIDLVLFNARVHTLEEGRLAAQAVAVRGDRIAWVGSDRELESLDTGRARLVNCDGQALVPGFVDAHCHLMAYASSLLAVNCAPPAVSSIADMKAAVRERAAQRPRGEWIRAAGYSEFDLAEGRHPDRHDLDDAAPHHPVKLSHRSGHATVLNSLALERVGIRTDTADPVDGAIERDWATGEPTGLLLEMDSYLESRVPSLSEDEMSKGMEMANRRLVSTGVTAVQDATPTNSSDRWEALRRWKRRGVLAPRVTMMAGTDYLDGLLALGLVFGSTDGELRLGPVKIMATTTTGELRPTYEELRCRVRAAHEAGFPVAVHAVDAEAVDAAILAIRQGRMESTRLVSERDRACPEFRDRIEHCSECSPETLARLGESKIVIVTQPGFVYDQGGRYLSEVDPAVRPWLYRAGSLSRAGVVTAASSDAPVIDPNPFVGIYAAVTRRARGGRVVGASEAVSADVALRMYTLNGAYAGGAERETGSIKVGKRADLALLDRDPISIEPECILRTKVTLTLIGGRVVWEG